MSPKTLKQVLETTEQVDIQLRIEPGGVSVWVPEYGLLVKGKSETEAIDKTKELLARLLNTDLIPGKREEILLRLKKELLSS